MSEGPQNDPPLEGPAEDGSDFVTATLIAKQEETGLLLYFIKSGQVDDFNSLCRIIERQHAKWCERLAARLRRRDESDV